MGGSLPEREDLIPRVISKALSLGHVGEDLSDHRIAIDMAIGKGSDIDISGFLGELLADEGHPFIHQRSSSRLQEIRSSHGSSIILANQELEQLPGGLGVFGPRVDAETIRSGQRHPSRWPRWKWSHPHPKIGSRQNRLERPRTLFDHGDAASDESILSDAPEILWIIRLEITAKRLRA